MRTLTRWATAAAAIALAAGCSITDDLLDVQNPDELGIEGLNDVSLLEVQLAGAIDAFQGTYAGSVIEYATFATDEMVTGLNWEDYARVNQRIISWLEGPTEQIYEGLQRGHRLGADLAERIRGWATEDPSRDFSEELSTALIFSGYSALALAENMCQALFSPDPNNPSTTILSQDETFAHAITFLTDGMQVADGGGHGDLGNLARTGLARANLGMANYSAAATFGNQVTAGFEWWLDFVDISGGRNPLQNTSHGGNFTHGIHPNFMGTHPSFDGTGFSFRDNDIIDPQTDPRIQHIPTDRTGHNRLTPLYKFIQGLRYSQFNGETISATCAGCTGTDPDDMPLLAEFDTDILMADYTEAQHHMYEAMDAMGGNDAAVLAFVNARRTVGNQPPLAGGTTGQALTDALRDQRARDLFMGGFRLPDLRRWTRFDPGNGLQPGGSYFPVGQHPNAQWGDYDEWTCFPIPRSEYEGNPGLALPTDPNTPPAI